MTKSFSLDVLCVGSATYDLSFFVEQHPTEDSKILANAYWECGGGPASNAAVAVSRMGGISGFVGHLGTDVFGKKHFEELQKSGVITNWIVRSSDPTTLSTIIIKPNGDRTVVAYRFSKPLDDFSYLLSGLYPKVLLFDGSEPNISIQLIEQAKSQKINTILDAGLVNSGTSLLYDKVDYLICSKKFALDKTGDTTVDLALKTLSKKAPFVIITQGHEGIVWTKHSVSGKMGAFEVDVLDTTGAGDTFHGVFAWCLAKGTSWDTSLTMSSAAAALSCTQIGARSSIPTFSEVQNFLKSKYSALG